MSDFEPYRIEVHSIKSSAAMAGLSDLSALARQLEMLARNKDLQGIDGLHATFMEEWGMTYEQWSRQQKEETAVPKKSGGRAVLARLLEILQISMADMNVDTADRIMQEILSYSYESVVSERLRELKDAVMALDEELADKLIEELTCLVSPAGESGLADAAGQQTLKEDFEIGGNREPAVLVHRDSVPARKTVMVVDDDSVMLRIVKNMLDKDYNVVIVPSGIKAVSLIEKKHPDIIFLDYEMPECNGAQTLEKIRGEQSAKDIPVVFMTGTEDAEHMEKLMALKPAGYLLKPVGKGRLKETIESLV